jgi:hypothetical protein
MRKILLIVLQLGLAVRFSGDAVASWQTLAPGMELGEIAVADPPAGNARITVLRMDPRLCIISRSRPSIPATGLWRPFASSISTAQE